MSLILKGIDLPKEDDFISLEIHKDEYRIYFTTRGAMIKEKRGEAIQIPKKHVRIVDISDVVIEEDVYYRYFKVDAPTILEAEGEE